MAHASQNEKKIKKRVAVRFGIKIAQISEKYTNTYKFICTLFFVNRMSKVQSFCMLILKSKFLNFLVVPGSGRLVIS